MKIFIMSKDLIKIGIIGSGYISDFHIHVLKSFKSELNAGDSAKQ